MLEHCDAGESMRGRRREVDYSRRKGDVSWIFSFDFSDTFSILFNLIF
jgi:hypothetical protein